MCLVVGAGDEICEIFLMGKNPQVYENNPAWPPECKTTIYSELTASASDQTAACL